MIDLVKNFKKHEKEMTILANGQKEDYFGHDTYKNLESRVEKLKKSNNMDFGERFIGKFGTPIQKSVSLMRKMVFDQNYRHEQLFYIKPTESTDAETATNIENTLADNLRRTKFKSRAFNIIKLNCAEYGASVCYSTPGILRNTHFKTQKFSENGITTIRRVQVDEPDIVIHNKSIHPLLYFQDPDCPTPEESLWQGHLERWDIPEYVAYVMNNKDLLINKNVQATLDDIKKSGRIDQFYMKDQENKLTKYPVDVTKLYSTLNITGNEDNLIPYYIEMVDDKIIRIEQNVFDENLRPYSILKFIPRNDVWWGNCDGEFQIPHENAYNTLIGLQLGNAIRSQDIATLYPRGAIDMGDWNERKTYNGWVPVDVPDGMNFPNMIYKHQTTNDAKQDIEFMFRELNSSRQMIGSTPNVNQRVSKTSPLANTTATAVQSMEEISDIKEGSYMENFNYGMINIAKVNITLIQQFFPDSFSVVSSPGKSESLLNKEEIMGSSEIEVKTALTNNKMFEAQRYINGINTVFNWLGTMHPDAQKINLVPLIKTALHRLDLGDINELYNEDAQGMPPQVPQQGQQQGAPPIA